jgi:alkanesulfonate monooxygenase SsuD/methylene tetrahydromethanopterin reductase-like flavin-dependent oxidoreductase (luciferase family)
MRLSLQLSKQHPPQDDPQVRFREHLEQLRIARDTGFDAVVVGQHFLSEPYQEMHTVVLLARLAAEAGHMRLGPCVLLLPLLNPVDVAEQMATFDVITGGRAIMGVGLGYRDIEFEAFGVDPAHKVSRFRESLDLIRRLWTEGRVEFHGRHHHVSGGQVALKPVQAGGPPVWMAANADSAIRRAARLADVWVINPHSTLPTLVRQVQLYREALNEYGRPFPDELPVIRECVLAETVQAAQATAARYLAGKYEAYEAWGQDRALPEGETFSLGFADLAKDRFIIGDPESAVDEIQRYAGMLGANNFILRVQFPGMPQADVVRSLRLLGERVLPRL